MRATNWMLNARCWGVVVRGPLGSFGPEGSWGKWWHRTNKGKACQCLVRAGRAAAVRTEAACSAVVCGLSPAGSKQALGRLQLSRIWAPFCIRRTATDQNLNQKISKQRGNGGNSATPYADGTVIIVSGRNHQWLRKSVGRRMMKGRSTRCLKASFLEIFLDREGESGHFQPTPSDPWYHREGGTQDIGGLQISDIEKAAATSGVFLPKMTCLVN